MTNNLLVKATALLEGKTDAATAANLALEIVPAYQDLVRRMAEALDKLLTLGAPKVTVNEYVQWEIDIRAAEAMADKVLAEARAAITHTPTDS